MAKFDIRKIYLYAATLIGLIVVLIGAGRLVNLGLKAWVFTEADVSCRYPAVEKPMTSNGTSTEVQSPTEEELQEYEENQRRSRRQRDAAESLAFVIVGLPVYLYHWRKVQKDHS